MQAIGPIDDPARKFNHQKLQSYLLQRGIGSIVDRVLPGVLGGSSRQNAPQNQQNTQQTEAAKDAAAGRRDPEPARPVPALGLSNFVEASVSSHLPCPLPQWAEGNAVA